MQIYGFCDLQTLLLLFFPVISYMSKSLIRFHTCLASISNYLSQFSPSTKIYDWFSAVTVFFNIDAHYDALYADFVCKDLKAKL